MKYLSRIIATIGALGAVICICCIDSEGDLGKWFAYGTFFFTLLFGAGALMDKEIWDYEDFDF